MVQYTDIVVSQINDALGKRQPEQGGALLGFPESGWVTTFIHDVHAEASQSIYHNSSWLIEEIARRESVGPERFMGIIHSHPSRMPHPSSQDRSEYQETLHNNPGMQRYVAPIVTHDVSTDLGTHEFIYRGCRISTFIARGSATQFATTVPAQVDVQPIEKMLNRAGLSGTQPVPLLVEGTPMLVGATEIPNHGQCTIFFGSDFPTTSPLIIKDIDDRPLAIPWHLDENQENRLDHALKCAAANPPDSGEDSEVYSSEIELAPEAISSEQQEKQKDNGQNSNATATGTKSVYFKIEYGPMQIQTLGEIRGRMKKSLQQKVSKGLTTIRTSPVFRRSIPNNGRLKNFRHEKG